MIWCHELKSIHLIVFFTLDSLCQCLFLSLSVTSPPPPPKHTHAHTHARTHARTHAHTHTHTQLGDLGICTSSEPHTVTSEGKEERERGTEQGGGILLLTHSQYARAAAAVGADGVGPGRLAPQPQPSAVGVGHLTSSHLLDSGYYLEFAVTPVGCRVPDHEDSEREHQQYGSNFVTDPAAGKRRHVYFPVSALRSSAH